MKKLLSRKEMEMIFRVIIIVISFTSLAEISYAENIIIRTNADVIYAEKILAHGGAGISVLIKPNTYTITETFRINRSNVTINAEKGAKFVIADSKNRPVISIGSQEPTPTYAIENISIKGIEIDGNKAKQQSETDPRFPYIRNNGIDVRGVKNLTLENVVSRNARSGGLVISYGCLNVFVKDSIFSDNQFDGVAYYTSQNVFTTNCYINNNGASGISIDNDLQDCMFSGCLLDSNKDNGVFARSSSQIRFFNVSIQNSTNYAIFLGENTDWSDINKQGVHDIMFSGCHFLNNCTNNKNTNSIYVGSDALSSNISIVSSVFYEPLIPGPVYQSSGTKIWDAGNIIQ